MYSTPEWLTIILASITSSSAIAAVIIWLSKSYISEKLKSSIQFEYDQKLETHKNSLQAQTASEIERFKSAQQIFTLEHQIRFSRLHEKAAETIAETFVKLRELEEAVFYYVKDTSNEEFQNTLPDRKERYKKAHQEFRDYYLPRRIYLPPDIALKIKEFDNEVYVVANEFSLYIERLAHTNVTQKKWMEIKQRLIDKVGPLEIALETAFRQYLGVIDLNQSSQ